MRTGTVLVGSVITFAVWVCFLIGVCFVLGSTITSGIKVLTHQCGTRYGVEDAVRGDWFCPAKQ